MKTSYKKCLAKISIIAYQRDKHTLYGYYYNYRIVMAPVSEKSGKVCVGVFLPGVISSEGMIWSEEVAKRVFNRGLISAVVFINRHYSRV